MPKDRRTKADLTSALEESQKKEEELQSKIKSYELRMEQKEREDSKHERVDRIEAVRSSLGIQRRDQRFQTAQRDAFLLYNSSLATGHLLLVESDDQIREICETGLKRRFKGSYVIMDSQSALHDLSNHMVWGLSTDIKGSQPDIIASKVIQNNPLAVLYLQTGYIKSAREKFAEESLGMFEGTIEKPFTQEEYSSLLNTMKDVALQRGIAAMEMFEFLNCSPSELRPSHAMARGNIQMVKTLAECINFESFHDSFREVYELASSAIDGTQRERGLLTPMPDLEYHGAMRFAVAAGLRAIVDTYSMPEVWERKT